MASLLLFFVVSGNTFYNKEATRHLVPNAPLESYTLNQDVVLRLLRVILATVYNYHEPYKFTKDDLFWL